MAKRLKITNNRNALIEKNKSINVYELLSQTKDKYYQNQLLIKTEALEKLSGVKNSGKTYYSELKKSMAEMQKCNLFLSQSQRDIEVLYELLKKKAEQTAAILEVSRAVGNILPFDQILQKTTSLVSELLGPVECSLFKLNQHPKLTLIPYVSDIPPYCKYLNQHISKSNRWFVLVQYKHAVKLQEANTEFLAVPLVSRSSVIGALTIRKELDNKFTTEEIELCTGIANPVAVAIENRELVEKLETESLRFKTALLSLKVTSDNLAMLNQGVEQILQTIGESLLKITDADYGILFAATDKLISLHVPEKLEKAEVLDTYFSSWLAEMTSNVLYCPYGIRHIKINNDPNLVFLSESYGFQEMMAFPMITRERVLGLVLLFFRQYKGDDQCRSILEVFGNQTALVLENAQLFEDTLSLKNQAEAHYRVVCQQKEQLEQKNEELKNMYKILFRTHEEQIITQERNRIAADLHDNVLQILFAIGLNFEWCTKQLAPDSAVYTKFKYLDELVNKAVQEIRSVVCEFSAGDSSISLYDSIDSLVQDLNKAGSAKIMVETIGEIPRLPSVVRNIAFRIVQEALVNALRHASATIIKVKLSYINKHLQIVITDNGVGVSDNIMENLPSHENKFGLKNTLQRVQFVNGTLDIKRLNSGGTEVLVEIPV